MPIGLINGYYGRHNAGDDALLVAAAWGAVHTLGCDRLLATARTLPETYGYRVHPLYGWQRFPGARRLRPLAEYLQASRATCLIFGGGTIFRHGRGARRWLRLARMIAPGTRVAAGVSLGPFETAAAERGCRAFLREMDQVGVRDLPSLERARALAPEAAVRLTFDLAPLLDVAAGGQATVPQDPARRRGLGVDLLPTQPGQALVGTVAEAIGRCVARDLVDEVVLVDLSGDARSGPHRAHQDLAERLRGRVAVRHVPYRDDPLVTMDAIGGVRAMVGMRLHAAVFAYCRHTPALVLSYAEKGAAWAEMVGLDPALVQDAARLDAEELAGGVERLLTGAAPEPRLPLEEARAGARANFPFPPRGAG